MDWYTRFTYIFGFPKILTKNDSALHALYFALYFVRPYSIFKEQICFIKMWLSYHAMRYFCCQLFFLKSFKNFLDAFFAVPIHSRRDARNGTRPAVSLSFTFHTLDYSQTFYNNIIEICLKSLL